MLFPSHFDAFRVSSINVGKKQSPETSRFLNLWDGIERSKIWGQFVIAAEELRYDELRDMGDVFYFV